MSYRLGQRAVPAPYALPAGFAMFLAVSTAAAALHGRLTATGVLVGRRARRGGGRGERFGRSRVRPGVPLVLEKAHTGKRG